MLILASNSPRRHEILSGAGYEFEVIPAKGEEVLPDLPPERAAVEIAKAKALEVRKSLCGSEKYRGCVVLAADTIVVLQDEIMGKPRDKADASRMLTALSGVSHTVITGVFVTQNEKSRSFYKRTSVEFHKLQKHEINAYIATAEPFDKAGAYGIQEKGALLVKGIRGDYFNVMGLPIAMTSRVLRDFGVTPTWQNPTLQV
ncbi:MAG: Maf family protein [Oscillospiraceae bacterium]|nr:Maf family protein [Oscillospiraceae bacterium]